jgi:membrane protein DedA with SNARE-associated domain
MATQQLPGFLRALAPTLNHHGYLAVAGFIFLEDFGIPVPGETILIAAAIYAGSGRLNIVLVALIGFVAAVVGDNVGYLIGRFGGRPLVEHYGRYIFLTPERIDKATGFFERQGPKIIVVARFIEGLRQANGIVAGLSEMHWLRFVLFNSLGAALWVGLWTSVGYLAGSHVAAIYSYVTRYFLIAVIVAAVAIAAYVALRLHRRHARNLERAKARAEGEGDAG